MISKHIDKFVALIIAELLHKQWEEELLAVFF